MKVAALFLFLCVDPTMSSIAFANSNAIGSAPAIVNSLPGHVEDVLPPHTNQPNPVPVVALALHNPADCKGKSFSISQAVQFFSVLAGFLGIAQAGMAEYGGIQPLKLLKKFDVERKISLGYKGRVDQGLLIAYEIFSFVMRIAFACMSLMLAMMFIYGELDSDEELSTNVSKRSAMHMVILVGVVAIPVAIASCVQLFEDYEDSKVKADDRTGLLWLPRITFVIVFVIGVAAGLFAVFTTIFDENEDTCYRRVSPSYIWIFVGVAFFIQTITFGELFFKSTMELLDQYNNCFVGYDEPLTYKNPIVIDGGDTRSDDKKVEAENESCQRVFGCLPGIQDHESGKPETPSKLRRRRQFLAGACVCYAGHEGDKCQTKCPDGSVTVAGKDGCMPCETDMVAIDNICLKCPAGKYIGNTKCEKCPSDTYSNTINAPLCANIPPNHEADVAHGLNINIHSCMTGFVSNAGTHHKCRET